MGNTKPFIREMYLAWHYLQLTGGTPVLDNSTSFNSVSIHLFNGAVMKLNIAPGMSVIASAP